MEYVILGFPILIGVCIYFILRVITRIRRNKPTGSRLLDLDTWSFDLESSDPSALEQSDNWVLG